MADETIKNEDEKKSNEPKKTIIEYRYLPPFKEEKQVVKEKLSKKDKIDFALKILGLGSLLISFLVYQSNIHQQYKTEEEQQVKGYKDSIASLHRSITEDQKYKREQIRADSFLTLKQIEVDSSIKQKQLELQQSLGNSFKAIAYQNELILKKGRFDNQVNLFSETVSMIKKILASDYKSSDYVSYKNPFI